MFQSLWREGLKWDDELSQASQLIWEEWFEDLILVSQIKIPRCYLGESDVTKQELHLFCDASELAYATVAYWRLVHNSSSVKLALIGSKSRVAPLKPTSIPRLELQAALIAARLASFICDAHKYKPVRRIFWTDSRNVLSWLSSDARSYKPFVAHRLGEILELTEPSECRWVPTIHNVADDATRIKRSTPTQKSRCVVGPSFLLDTESEWPSFPYLDMANNTSRLHDVDLKSSANNNHLKVHHITSTTSSIPLVVDARRLSSWNRLIRATARAHKFITLIKNKNSQKDLTAEDMSLAELHILRQSQLDSFPREYNDLKNNIPVSKRSSLYNLSPILDDDGLIRICGRINRVQNVDHNTKRPVILNSKHPATRLLITYYHNRAAHANNETVVNELRQQYWIIHLRSAVRSVAHNCQFCRIRRARPFEPPMGDLPAARLIHHRRPFSFVGLDYFGPIQVTIGRKRDKRYVALYTCLVTRAIHLEVVHSLSSDAAMMSLRRFISRRGTPSEIWSDNGTAFVGVNRIMKTLYDVSTFAANEKISWKFIPPHAPFMAGAWERLVRSVKTALRITLRERAPTDEVLQTLLAEAESLVNSRPLTHVSVEVDTEESLTPFHFILGSSSGRAIPATSNDNDLVSRTGWRKAIRLSDHFWKRWVKEYLPTLLPRPGKGTPPNIKIGDMVFVVDDQLPRGTWPRGRVTRLFPGADGVIRVAEVKTSAGLLNHPAKKLVPLTS